MQQELELTTEYHRSSLIDMKLSYDSYQISSDQKEKSDQMRLKYSECADLTTSTMSSELNLRMIRGKLDFSNNN